MKTAQTLTENQTSLIRAVMREWLLSHPNDRDGQAIMTVLNEAHQLTTKEAD